MGRRAGRQSQGSLGAIRERNVIGCKTFAEDRPAVVIRIGVTGSRRLKAAALAEVRRSTRFILGWIKEKTVELAADRSCRSVYRSDGEDSTETALRLVSPLAEGADCLVAEEGLELGYRLFSPLPFALREYENDFGERSEAFRRLAAQATLFELDGARGQSETASYEAVGRFVVRNIDILVALWDGKPAHGRGGTAEIVQFAVEADTPVWWINVEDASARLILNGAQLRRPESAFTGVEAEVALARFLENAVLPPPAPRSDGNGLVGLAVHRLCGAISPSCAPLTQYLAEKPPPRRFIWNAYACLTDVLAPKGKAPDVSPRTPTPVSDIELWWSNHFARADRLAQAYGDRYRSSYVLVAFAALLAFLVSFGSSFSLHALAVFAMEFLFLSLILILVVFNHMNGWRERWISYRLLAELSRAQFILSPLGRNLPGIEAQRSARAAASRRKDAAPLGEAWASWCFLALQRGAPLPVGASAAAKARAVQLGTDLVTEQIEYHRQRETRASRAARRLAGIGEASFLLVVALTAVLFFSALLTSGSLNLPTGSDFLARSMGLAIRFSSGVSAAFVGLGAYAEFALLARQSAQMREGLSEIKAELRDVELPDPLASGQIAVILFRLSILLMQEAHGWAQIFRLNILTAG